MFDPGPIESEERHNEPCVWECIAGGWKALGKMLIAIAKTLGIEVETVEAGEISQASSLRIAC